MQGAQEATNRGMNKGGGQGEDNVGTDQLGAQEKTEESRVKAGKGDFGAGGPKKKKGGEKCRSSAQEKRGERASKAEVKAKRGGGNEYRRAGPRGAEGVHWRKRAIWWRGIKA